MYVCMQMFDVLNVFHYLCLAWPSTANFTPSHNMRQDSTLVFRYCKLILVKQTKRYIDKMNFDVFMYTRGLYSASKFLYYINIQLYFTYLFGVQIHTVARKTLF